MEFGKKKPAGLYNVIHDTKNPLNWFERMRKRQQDKPVLLNANVGQIHRTIEIREQAMVAKSGSGDQRAVGKLAAMNDRDYYRTHSGILNLSRSNPQLIQKIREASVPDNSMVSGLDAEVKDAVVEGSEGGDEGEEGGGASPASAPTTLVVPEMYKEYDASVGSIPKPTGGTYEADKEGGMPIEELVAKHGPVPNAELSTLVAVALGDMPSNGFIAKKTADYIRDVLKVEIGSRKFFELMKYEATKETTMTEEEYEAGKAAFYKAHPSYKPTKPLAQSKKELDELLVKAREKESKDLVKMLQQANANYIIDNALLPFKSGDKDTVRSGLNTLLRDMGGAVKLVNETRPELDVKWPSSIEVRKTSNNEKIGRLFIDGKDINQYVENNKEDPNLADTLAKIGGVFEILQEHLKSIRPFSEIDFSSPRSTKELSKAIDDEYPLLRGIFGKLKEQIDESLKPFRPKGKGGKPPGSGKKGAKKDANVTAVLAPASAPASVGGATSADTVGAE